MLLNTETRLMIAASIETDAQNAQKSYQIL